MHLDCCTDFSLQPTLNSKRMICLSVHMCMYQALDV